jgi:4-amino-4-deoxy-L-arabinose transferase-like glycosyltransferase
VSTIDKITPTAGGEVGLADSVYLPEKSPTERRIVIAVFVLSFLYLYIFRRYTTMEPDEGIVLEGAQRVLRGEILYRDFFSFFTPGSYYFLAMIFKLFGNTFTVARVVLLVLGSCYSVLAYLLSRRVCSRSIALVVTGLMAATTLPFRFLVLHNWDSTLWACLAVYCSVRCLELPNWKWPFAVGSFTSLTFLFEQSKGAGLGLGLGVGLLIVALASPSERRFSSAQLSGFACGLLWPFVLAFAYFGAHHALGIMAADWVWPLQHYSAANRVPYGHQNWSDETRNQLFGTGSLFVRVITMVTMSPCFVIPLLPLVAAALGVYWTVRIFQKERDESKSEYYVVVCATLSGLLLSVVVVRADIIHFVYLQPLFCLVLAWVFEARDVPGGLLRNLRGAVVLCLVIAFSLFSIPLLIRATTASNSLTTRKGLVKTPRNDAVIPYVQKHVTEGEPMLVYPYLPLYQYLSATSGPSSLEYFQPGMNTSEQAQEMISQLASRRVRVVLFESSFVQKIPNSWPHTELRAIVNDPVADYILQEYRNCKILMSTNDWRFLFMVRKDLPCPGN